MSFRKSFVVFVLLSILLSEINAATTCNFYYVVPGIGPSCEMKGGLQSDLIDKYEELFGGLQGLKLIIDDQKGLGKITQDAFSRIQREQQIYAQNIRQIASDIQAVKNLLGIYPISPEIEQDGQRTKKSKRAVDPYQALRVALQDAEAKLVNMTSNMQDASRLQSMTFSTIEQRVQQQDLRLLSVLKKISDLENQAAMLPGSPQNQSSGAISSSSFTTLMNIATVSAKIQATTAIIQARVNDLNDRLREMDKPIQERVKHYQDLDNNLKHIQSGVLKLTTDAAVLSTDFNKYKNKLTQDLQPINSDMTQIRQKFKTLDSDTNRVTNQVQQKETELKQAKQTLQQAMATITQQKLVLSSIDPQIKNITGDISVLKQDPLVQLSRILSEEVAAKQKLDQNTGQSDRLAQGITTMINGLDTKLSKIQVNG